MADRIVIPREGQGMESALITEWSVKVGDEVAFGEELCEVESEKAAFPIESAVTGTVLAICFEAGDTVPVLETIAVVGKPGDSFNHLLPGAIESTVTDAEIAEPVQVPKREQQTAHPESERRRISPRAKRLAKTHRIDLDEISVDPIRERDVTACIDAKAIPTEGIGIGGKSTIEGFGADSVGSQRVPLTTLRSVIAERMFASVQSSAQFTLQSFADVTGALQYHRSIKENAHITTRITLNDLFLFVTAQTLSEHRALNAHFDRQRYVQFEPVHLGVAVDVPGGLMVPVIRNAQALSLEELARASAAAIKKCRNGDIKLSELEGGTFTVSNLGSMGIHHFTPILNYPEVAILGAGGISPRPIRTEAGIEHIDCVSLSLTINHQAVDGAIGAKFRQSFSENVASIDRLLAR